jgi:uncharacterized protein
MKLDCHVHLFGNSPSSGARLRPGLLRSMLVPVFYRRFGLNVTSDPVEREQLYISQLARSVEDSELDRAVLLAFDQIYDNQGKACPDRTMLHIPNDYTARTCRDGSEHFLFGASVHPYRLDAIEKLEQVVEEGAVLVKLLPNSHGFDPSDSKIQKYYRKMAQLKLPLLVHCGFEHTIPVIDQSFGNPQRLRPALDEGVTVIVAHAGSAGMLHRKETMGEFLELVAEYPNVYGDTAALANFWRSKYLFELLDPGRIEKKYHVKIEDPWARMVHGSDFPIPVTPFAFQRAIPRKDLKAVRRLGSVLQQDIELKRLAGVPDDCLTRLNDLLK